jgi:hypothetical protein
MQVIIMVFGSRDPNYFNYDEPDGYKVLRYVSTFHYTIPNRATSSLIMWPSNVWFFALSLSQFLSRD